MLPRYQGVPSGSGGGGSAGDVTGPFSSVDNALPRFDGTTGKALQGSAVTVDDSGNIQVPTSAAFNNPSLRVGESNSGIANEGSILRFIVSGVERVRVLSSRVAFLGGAKAQAPFATTIDTGGTDVALGPNDADLDTGIGSAGADNLSLLAGGVESARFTAARAIFPKLITLTRTSSTGNASTTQYPNSGDFGMHLNTTSGVRSLVINDGGAIYTIAFS